MSNTSLIVKININLPVEKVWTYWTSPEHIICWNTASDEWHSPRATNDLQTGGRFVYRMEAKDGSAGFDFSGVYESIGQYDHIAYVLGDGRRVRVDFSRNDAGTTITETFDADDVHPLDMQEAGWQAILDHFKLYAESRG